MDVDGRDSLQCRVCRSTRIVSAGDIPEPASRSGRLFLCGDCQSLSFFPGKHADPYGMAYYGAGKQKIAGLAGWMRRRSCDSRVRIAARLAAHAGNALDIGCGDGDFLEALKNRGWAVHGIERDAPAQLRAKARLGEDRVFNRIEDLPVGGMKFDLITLWQVFEHLDDPVSLIERLPPMLAPGGIFGIGVPNPLSWQAVKGGREWFHLDPPRHLHLSPEPTLAGLVTRRGLRLVRRVHPWMEYGIIGVVQTLFNKLGLPRDEFFDLLKTGGAAHPLKRAVYGLAVLALLPPASAWAAAESAAGKSATYELWFKID